MTERLDPFAALTLDQLRTRTSAKWRHYPADVLPLWVAEMDLPLAPAIADALVAVGAQRRHRLSRATPPTSRLSPAYAVDTWGWDPGICPHASRRSRVIAGYTDTIVDAIDPGSTVVVTSPVYPPFYSYLRQAGRVVSCRPLAPDLRLDLASARASPSPRRRLVGMRPSCCAIRTILAAPCTRARNLRRSRSSPIASKSRWSPTRSTHPSCTRTQPSRRTCPSTPRHRRRTRRPRAGTSRPCPQRSPSLGPTPTRLLRDSTPASIRAHVLGHRGADRRLRAGGEWLADALAALDRNRHLLGTLLASQLARASRYHLPESTYLTWLDCRDLGLGDDPAAVFLERGRVAFNSGHTFGTGGEGHVRVNIATSGEILAEAVDRMVASL